MLITFSGLDGAGKSTLIERLKITLEQQHCRVAVFHINDHVGVYAYLRALRDRVRGGGGTVPSNGSPPTAPPAPSSRLRAAYRRVRNAVLWNKPLRRLIYPVDLLVFLVYRVYVEKLRKQVLVMDRYFYDTLVDVAYDRSWGGCTCCSGSHPHPTWRCSWTSRRRNRLPARASIPSRTWSGVP